MDDPTAPPVLSPLIDFTVKYETPPTAMNQTVLEDETCAMTDDHKVHLLIVADLVRDVIIATEDLQKRINSYRGWKAAAKRQRHAVAYLMSEIAGPGIVDAALLDKIVKD